MPLRGRLSEKIPRKARKVAERQKSRDDAGFIERSSGALPVKWPKR